MLVNPACKHLCPLDPCRSCGYATSAVNSRRFSPSQENGFRGQGCGLGAWAPPWTTQPREVRPNGTGSSSAPGPKPQQAPTPTQGHRTGRSCLPASLLPREQTPCPALAPKVNHREKSKALKCAWYEVSVSALTVLPLEHAFTASTVQLVPFYFHKHGGNCRMKPYFFSKLRKLRLPTG